MRFNLLFCLVLLEGTYAIESAIANCKTSCTQKGNYCYVANTAAPMTNYAAQSYCSSVGGQLPFFVTQSDLTLFLDYKDNLTLRYIWLGYWNYDSHTGANPGIWKADGGTGQTAPFTVWSLGEPNDWGATETCAQIWSNDGWNDISCDPPAPYKIFALCMCTCSTISSIGNGTATPPQYPTFIGGNATFACNTGFRLVGPTYIVCTNVGQGVDWDQNPPYCEKLQCPDIFNTTKGTVAPLPYYSGNNYNFTCPDNTVMPGGNATSTVYQCDFATGTWKPPTPPICLATCNKILTFANGTIGGNQSSTVLVNRVISGSVATFSCYADLLIKGSKSLLCGSNGNWSEADPSCIATCPKTGNFVNGVIKYSGNITTMPTRVIFPSSADFYCNPDFELSGAEEIYCGTNGNWSDSVPICIDANRFWWWPFIVGFAGCILALLLFACCTKRMCFVNTGKTDTPSDYQNFDGKIFWEINGGMIDVNQADLLVESPY